MDGRIGDTLKGAALGGLVGGFPGAAVGGLVGAINPFGGVSSLLGSLFGQRQTGVPAGWSPGVGSDGWGGLLDGSYVGNPRDIADWTDALNNWGAANGLGGYGGGYSGGGGGLGGLGGGGFDGLGGGIGPGGSGPDDPSSSGMGGTSGGN